MRLRLFTIIILGMIISNHSRINAQCNLKISGVVFDQHDAKILEFATVYIDELKNGTVTDLNGLFAMNDLCPGEYHLKVSHLGCETKNLFLKLERDTFLEIQLEHHDFVLDEIQIAETVTNYNENQASSSLEEEVIQDNAGKTLAEMAENIAGVSAIRSGSVFKPVIHGMYGNRISILNNGVIQSGQQWGLDHAPEIDPFTTKNIKVIKGASSIRYGGNNLGGVVVLNPALPPDDPHIHGDLQYIFDYNGFGNTLATTLEQSTSWVDWRVIGTVKQKGDLSTPDYYLRNTGNEEQNVALQLNKSWNSKVKTETYYSLFHSKNGILRGAHIGNTTDLEAALSREIPFFTEEDFTYNIASPMQQVNHHLFKTKLNYLRSKYFYVDGIYAFQLNQRQEFDVRRGDRSEIPAMDLTLFQHTFEIYSKYFRDHHTFEQGIQLSVNDNTNNPGTGIRPLIPDYISYQPGVFSIYKFEKNRIGLETGIRYDYRFFEVLYLDNNNYHKAKHQYHNFSMDASFKFQPNSSSSITLNSALTNRSPEVNELYSAGLHQGVASIEEGDPNLQKETGLKTLLSFQKEISGKVNIDLTGYYQFINNYIYLAPEEAYRLTIRGAFPVFKYRQTNAEIYGMDFLTNVHISDHWSMQTKYAVIRGKNTSINEWLIRIPSDNINTSIQYEKNLTSTLKNLRLKLSYQYVLEQTRFNPEEELVAPPEGYGLLNFNSSVEPVLFNKEFRIGISVENIMNSAYRDYLDRLRFYANAPGRNIRVSVKMKF